MNQEEKISEASTSESKPSAQSVKSSALPGFLGTIDNSISRFEAFILAAGVLMMAGNSIANVIGRYVFQNSLFFSEELNRILIILITFAGVGYAARHGRHIRMSAIFDALPKTYRKALMIGISLITSISMFMLSYFAVTYILKVQTSGRILPSLQIPVYWIYLWVPIGFVVTAIQYLLTAIKNMTHSEIFLSTDVIDGYDDKEIEI